MHANGRESEFVNHAFPLHSRPPEVDQQSQMQARSFQVIDALRQMLVRELLYAFDFDQQTTLHHQIRRIRTDMLSFVGDWERSLGVDA